MTKGTAEIVEEPDDEHTVMVDRAAGEEPVVEEPDDEHTVAVDRAASADDEPDDEHTVMVDRAPSTGEDDHTVAVRRGASAAAGTDEDDHTVVVGRKPGKASLARTPSAKRRRGIAQPPVPEGFAPKAVDAIGPNAEVVYAPRAIPEPPPAPTPVAEGPAATRAAAPFMPSVLRRAQRTAHLTVLVFVAVCVVSVVGLSLIAVAVF